MNAGFRVIGIDSKPQPRYCGDDFMQMDAFDFFAGYMAGEFEEAAAFHCSPPCQGYSIMHNLPWLRGREYPLLILPVREMLETLGKPYVIENVMGARYGAKGLTKRGLEAHGLQAGWLCGTMFGLPFYRHRLFATNWFWLAPGHAKHVNRIRAGASLAGRARDIVFSAAEDSRGLESWPGRRGLAGNGLTIAPNRDVHQSFSVRAVSPTLASWQGNGAQATGVGVGHARGWRLAAEAMGIDWMNRDELTQAIPPVYTFFVATRLRNVLRNGLA